MKLFNIFALSVLTWGATALADQLVPPPPTGPLPVTLFASLSLTACTPGGVCMSPGNIVGTGTTITLYPLLNEPFHYRGYFTDVIEQDSVRFIGVITVESWDFMPGSGNTAPTPTPVPFPPNNRSYSFKVEIIGNQGVTAEMTMNAADPSQLNNVTLTGQTTKRGNTEYTPMFSVGPAVSSGIVPPPQPLPGKPAGDWNVIQGKLL